MPLLVGVKFDELLSASNEEHTANKSFARLGQNLVTEVLAFLQAEGLRERLGRLSFIVLDKMVAQAPELPDGTRCLQASPDEVGAMISYSTLPVKQKHMVVLQQALQKVQQENAALKQQYLASHAQLSSASQQIDSCVANLEQSAMQCERWSMSAVA